MNGPVVDTTSGAIEGVWRDRSAAFLGVPFAAAPVGRLRFAAPQPPASWEGVRDASQFGATPQRRPFAEVTAIPEPSFPGESTLNVNVFTPAPGDADAKLPVFVWIHGGGFFAGSPSSPWYDGASFNRDGVVTVSLSYRLGFEGFGWIEDAPTNRGVLDMVAGLQWVHDNIANFGGDPARVTIGGQSAGGSASQLLLACPAASGLFTQAISQSGADLPMTLERAERNGRELARRAGVEPSVAGWSVVSEDTILDLQAQAMMPAGPMPASAVQFVAATLAGPDLGIPFCPLAGDDVLPTGAIAGVKAGMGADKRVLAGTVAHEFTMMTAGFRDAWKDADPVAALVEGGFTEQAATQWVAAFPELPGTADLCGQLVTSRTFRLPTVELADARPHDTWVYDFRFVSTLSGQATHCLEVPFTWDLLGAPGVTDQTGPNPPQELADDMHGAWVRFIKGEDPGWGEWDGHNARVFGAPQADHYAADRLLAG